MTVAVPMSVWINDSSSVSRRDSSGTSSSWVENFRGLDIFGGTKGLNVPILGKLKNCKVGTWGQQRRMIARHSGFSESKIVRTSRSTSLAPSPFRTVKLP